MKRPSLSRKAVLMARWLILIGLLANTALAMPLPDAGGAYIGIDNKAQVNTPEARKWYTSNLDGGKGAW